MYFQNLESVRSCAEAMSRHKKPEERYNGIIPKIEAELPEAREQLGKYFREVWKDEIQALEIELSLTEENYHKKILKSMLNKWKF